MRGEGEEGRRVSSSSSSSFASSFLLGLFLVSPFFLLVDFFVLQRYHPGGSAGPSETLHESEFDSNASGRKW